MKRGLLRSESAMRRQFMRWMPAIAICVAGCAPSSLEDLRYQAEFEMKKLTDELRFVESKEDIENISKSLKKRFNLLADLLITVKKFPGSQTDRPSQAGDDLFAELARIYEIPGAREAIEAAQFEAVRRLYEAAGEESVLYHLS